MAANAAALTRAQHVQTGETGSLLGRIGRAVQVARERRALAEASPELLRDIGLDADAARAEADRPIWDLPEGR